MAATVSVAHAGHLSRLTNSRFAPTRCGLALTLLLTPFIALSAPALAQEAPAAAEAAGPNAAATATDQSAADTKGMMEVPILLVRQKREEPLPLSLLDMPPPDLGIAGAKLAVMDNNTTGRFLNQKYDLDVIQEADASKLIKDVVQKVDAGKAQFILADVAPDTLLKLSAALEGKPAEIINYSASDDRLRQEDCRPNIIHTAPSRAMLADALAQYLIWKKWNRWFLVSGPSPKDKLFADALKRSAKRFGGKIVDERTYTYKTGNRRADGGFEQIQQQIPSFTQSAPDYDVLLVADENNLFGDYLPYRTWSPRPVAGTSGLVPESWHPAIEYWGGTQFQDRFKKMADRRMRPLDYNAWLATRLVGEAASRTRSNKYKDLIAFLKKPDFEIAAFKGVGLSIRDWDGQVRQPVLLGSPKLLVSVSPQPGFLHQTTVLDTLGFDKPETKCKAYTQ